MKTTVKTLFVALLFMAPLLISAQDSTRKKLTPMEKEAKRKDLKALKVKFITEKLSLTSTESAAFWPMYNKYDEKKTALRKRQHEFKKANRAKKALTDAEIEKVVDAQILHKENMVRLDREFHNELKKTLPIKKVLAYYKAEKLFKKEVMNKMRKRKRKGTK